MEDAGESSTLLARGAGGGVRAPASHEAVLGGAPWNLRTGAPSLHRPLTSGPQEAGGPGGTHTITDTCSQLYAASCRCTKEEYPGVTCMPLLILCVHLKKKKKSIPGARGWKLSLALVFLSLPRRALGRPFARAYSLPIKP